MDWMGIIKTAYERKVPGYTDDGIKVFVEKGKITEEQYEEITNKEYTE